MRDASTAVVPLVVLFAALYASSVVGAQKITEFVIPGDNDPWEIVEDWRCPASGGRGCIWFTQPFRHKIGRFLFGTFTYDEIVVPTWPAYPRGIAVGPGRDPDRKDIWFTEEWGNKIGRVVSGTMSIIEYVLPHENSGPYSIALGPDEDDMWFTENKGKRIGRISDLGKITEFNTTGFPRHIAESGGSLWFTQSNPDGIGRVLAHSGSLVVYRPPTDSLLTGITKGPNGGGIWFTMEDAYKIGYIDSIG